MQQPSLTLHGCGKGCFEVQAALETGARPHEYVGRRAGAPKNCVCQVTGAALRRCVVCYDDEQIVITIGTSIASRLGAKQIHPLGLVRGHQPPYDLGKDGITPQDLGALTDSRVVSRTT